MTTIRLSGRCIRATKYQVVVQPDTAVQGWYDDEKQVVLPWPTDAKTHPKKGAHVSVEVEWVGDEW